MQGYMLQACRGTARLIRTRVSGGAHSFAASSTSAAQPQATYDVPAGHASSDLSDIACNLSLSRRRDLTLRQDLYLTQDGKTVSIADLLKDKIVAMFGVPDMGKVCTDLHYPDFLKNVDRLRKKGVQRIVCTAVAPYSDLKQWASKQDPDHKICLVADESGGLVRLLGLEIAPKADGSGPRSQRFSALIEGGILLKLKVEPDIGEVKYSSSDQLLKSMHSLKCGSFEGVSPGETSKTATAL